MEKKKVTIEVEGTPDEVKSFIELCIATGALCSVGASREISFHVDGDGSANLKFNFPDFKKETITKFAGTLNHDLDSEKIVIYCGE